MDRPFEHLQREYASMQTGRAAPSLLDSVRVDVGGGAELQPLPSLAKVLAQGPQALQVSVLRRGHMYNMHMHMHTCHVHVHVHVHVMFMYMYMYMSCSCTYVHVTCHMT